MILFFLIAYVQTRLLFQNDFTNKFQTSEIDQISTSCEMKFYDQRKILFSGYLNVDINKESALAYIFYACVKVQSVADIVNFPTILVLNGGPGSASMNMNFMEMGPMIVSDSHQFKQNPYTWTTNYNLIFIDQPIGTGYSYAASIEDIPTTDQEIAEQFTFALNELLNSCPIKYQFSFGNWFFYGREYAVKFIGAIAKLILKKDQIKIKGIILGESFANPSLVLSETPNYAFNLGLIDYQERQKYEIMTISALQLIENGRLHDAHEIFDDMLKGIIYDSGGLNVYNIFEDNNYKEAEAYIESYLNQNETKQEFHFKLDIPFIGNDKIIFETLYDDFLKSDAIDKQIINFINYQYQKVAVLIYNGQNDLSVPCSGSMRWVYQLKYEYRNEFFNQDFKAWIINNQVAGYVKRVANLEYRVILDSGQYTGVDQPVSLLNMIENFISFNTNQT